MDPDQRQPCDPGGQKFQIDAKAHFVWTIFFISTPLLGFLSWARFREGDLGVGGILVFMWMAVAIGLVQARKNKGAPQEAFWLQTSLIVFTICLGLVLIYIIGFEGRPSRLPWVFLFLLLCVYTFGSGYGLVGAAAVLIILLLRLHSISVLEEASQESMVFRFLASAFSFTLLLIWIEHDRRRNETFLKEERKAILKSEDRLRVLNSEMEQEIQERRLIESRLVKREEQYRLLVENINDVAFSLDLSGIVTFISPVVEKRIGLFQHEIVGRSFAELVHPEDMTKFDQAWNREKDGTGEYFEFRLRKSDGTCRWAQVSLRPIVRDGSVIGFSGLWTEIHDRKRAEEALRKSEERYRRFQQESVLGIFRTTLGGRIVSVNPAFAGMFGYDGPDHLLAEVENDSQLYCSPTARFGLVEQVVLDRLPFQGENHYRRRDGREFFGDLHVWLVAEGEAQYLEGFIEDISEKRKAREILVESEARYRSLFQESPISLWESDFSKIKREFGCLKNRQVLDIEKYWKDHPEKLMDLGQLIHVLDVNEATLTLFELNDLEELRQALPDLIRQAKPGLFCSFMAQMFAEKKSGKIETINLTTPGREKDLSLSWSVAPGHEESLTRVFFSIFDISQQKRTERALKESEERLRVMFQEAPDPYYLNDLEGRFVDGNRAAEQFLGYEKEEMIGRDFLEAGILPSDQIEKAMGHLEQNRKGFPTGPDSLVVTRKDGSLAELEIRTFPVQIQGRPIVLGIGRDTSERRRTLNQLRLQRDLGLALNSVSGQEDALLLGLKTAMDISETDMGGVYRYHSELGVVRLVGELGGSPELQAMLRKIEEGDGPIRRLVQECPVVFQIEEWEVLPEEFQDSTEVWTGPGRVIAIPIKHENRPLACIGLFSLNPGELPPASRHFLESLGNQLGVHLVRLEAERALRKSEKEYRATLDAMDDWVFVTDPNLIIILANESFVKWNQQDDKKRNLIGERVFRVLPEVSDLFQKGYERVLETGRGVVLEEKAVVKSRPWFLEIRIIPILGHEGQVDRIVTVVRDTTGQKLAETKLRESEDRYRVLVETSPYGIQLSDREGQITFCNTAHNRMMGYEPGELIGKKIWEFVANPAEREALKEFYRRISVEQPAPVTYQGQVRTRDGGVLDVMVDWNYILDPNGRIENLVSVISDITRQKQDEKRIKGSLKEKEILLKEIHHRVKNNLQLIVSLLNLQAGSIQDLRVREALADSRDRIRSMALIHETLYMADSLARINIREYAMKLGRAIRRSFKPAVGRVDVSIQAEDLWIEIDQAVPFGIVLNELMTNAFKYAFPGGREGKVWIQVRVVEGSLLELLVKDNGVGLPPDLDHANSRSLGFKIIHLLVENQLDGTITVESQQGAQFLIRWPLALR